MWPGVRLLGPRELPRGWTAAEEISPKPNAEEALSYLRYTEVRSEQDLDAHLIARSIHRVEEAIKVMARPLVCESEDVLHQHRLRLGFANHAGVPVDQGRLLVA